MRLHGRRTAGRALAATHVHEQQAAASSVPALPAQDHTRRYCEMDLQLPVLLVPPALRDARLLDLPRGVPRLCARPPRRRRRRPLTRVEEENDIGPPRKHRLSPAPQHRLIPPRNTAPLWRHWAEAERGCGAGPGAVFWGGSCSLSSSLCALGRAELRRAAMPRICIACSCLRVIPRSPCRAAMQVSAALRVNLDSPATHLEASSVL